MTTPTRITYVVVGAAFGFVLSRSGAADYNYIQSMFLFTNLQLFLIMGMAVAIAAPGLWVMKRYGRSLGGERLAFPVRPLRRGQLLGGALFGIGWSIAGMCPGPIWVNIGEGKLYAFAAMAGALTGTALFGWMAPRIRPMD
jgi:uncharacterized membrane protein YedE/YeeE